MKFCTNCGSQLDEGQAKCNACGEQVQGFGMSTAQNTSPGTSSEENLGLQSDEKNKSPYGPVDNMPSKEEFTGAYPKHASEEIKETVSSQTSYDSFQGENPYHAQDGVTPPSGDAAYPRDVKNASDFQNKSYDKSAEDMKSPYAFPKTDSSTSQVNSNFNQDEKNQKKFDSTSNQYGSAPNQYGSAPNQYGSASNQYGSAPNQYGSAQKPNTNTQNQYGSAQSSYGSAPNQYGSQQNQYGANQGQNNTNYSGSGQTPYGYQSNPQQGQVQYGGQQPKNNVFAIISLILGILSLLVCCFLQGFTLILAIPGAILGVIGYQKGDSGKGMALAGIITNGVAILLGIIVGILGAAFLKGLSDEIRRSSY